MEDIKKEKKNSFFKGVAVATIVVGTILTAFYSILMISEAKRYRERIDEIVKVTEAAQEEGGDLISEEFIQKSNLIYNGILKEFYCLFHEIHYSSLRLDIDYFSTKHF